MEVRLGYQTTLETIWKMYTHSVKSFSKIVKKEKNEYLILNNIWILVWDV